MEVPEKPKTNHSLDEINELEALARSIVSSMEAASNHFAAAQRDFTEFNRAIMQVAIDTDDQAAFTAAFELRQGIDVIAVAIDSLCVMMRSVHNKITEDDNDNSV